MSESHSKPSRFRLIALIAIPLVIMAGGLTYAHQGTKHSGHGHGDRVEHHLAHLASVLTKIGAADDQKSQIDGMMRVAFENMEGVREAHHAAFGQFHELLFAETIDRVKIESLRVDQIRAFDEASKGVVTAFEDAAEVLTPEQRAAFAQEMRKIHGE